MSTTVTKLKKNTPATLPFFVNDVHSQLNRTRVAGLVAPDSLAALQRVVREARTRGQAVCVAGGQHAMGGQQFGTDALLVNTSRLNRVLNLDAERGLIEVGAGIQWPALIEATTPASCGWGIAQKQTGADRLSLGGALAANIHGRGLAMRPIIGDVESFVLVDAEGAAHTCNRHENAELFCLAIGGYGLFGLLAQVTLRLAPRRKVQRVVEIADLRELSELFAARIRDGFLYGDFQFATERESDDFLRCGVFSCYRPVADDTPIVENQKELAPQEWRELLYLAHTNRQRAFDLYAQHYLATDGQVYWSDTHQLSVYLDHYHQDIDTRRQSRTPASEMITEIYVPRERLADFMEAVRTDFRRDATPLIYGTIRLIEKDEESFLAWARESFACVVFNLCVTHDAAGLHAAGRAFRGLIDRALERGGSYYLTYHRWATRAQVLAAYPQFPEFMRLKRQYDPAGRFQSDWFQHHRNL